MTNTPINVIATHPFATESITRIIQHTRSNKENPLPAYTILIHREEDLHHFVQNIPDLAWEMLEYAEEPLELVFPKKKYKSPFEDDDSICLRLVRQGKLSQLIRKYGALITFPVVVKAALPVSLIDEEINCTDPQNQYKYVKTMKLFEDGTFTFLR